MRAQSQAGNRKKQGRTVTGYERIITNFNKKVKTDDDDDDDDHGREVVQDQPGGW